MHIRRFRKEIDSSAHRNHSDIYIYTYTVFTSVPYISAATHALTHNPNFKYNYLVTTTSNRLKKKKLTERERESKHTHTSKHATAPFSTKKDKLIGNRAGGQ